MGELTVALPVLAGGWPSGTAGAHEQQLVQLTPRHADAAAMERLEQRLARGLQFADTLGFTNQQEIRDNAVLLHSLAELLVARGVIRLHELEERKKAVASYFDDQEARPTVHLAATEDKYAADVVTPVDCAARMHICHAICCRLWFALSVQDLEERIVRWNYAQPYGIAQGEDGRCVHQERTGAHRCRIYENRPLICRTYSCREDKRIWLDFANRVINPAIMAERWPEDTATSTSPALNEAEDRE